MVSESVRGQARCKTWRLKHCLRDRALLSAACEELVVLMNRLLKNPEFELVK